MMKTITLTYPHVTAHSSEAYRVVQIVGSTDYTPGQVLEKAEVKDLCDLGIFKVIMNRKPKET